MSTTIKPLEVYIKGTKVFPDVDLSGTMLSGTSLLDGILGLTDYIQESQSAYIYPSETLKDYPYIMPPMEDGSTSNWHTWTDGEYNRLNYWNFGNTNVYDIQFDIDAAYLWQRPDDRHAFNNTKVKTLNFKGTLHHLDAYNSNDWENPDILHVYSQFYCNGMFQGCELLEEINGLTFDSSQQYIYEPTDGRIETKIGGAYIDELIRNFDSMFNGCYKLRKLDITWPTESNQVTLHGDSFNAMFAGCTKLPDNQVPTFKLVPMSDSGSAYSDFHGLIDISNMFLMCGNIANIKITNDSWQYIFGANSAFDQTGIHSIDIPATATNLKYVRFILGYNLQSTVATPDWSDSKFVIRTTAPMDFYINGATTDGDLQLFNYGDYDSNQTFIHDFGGIYVPDSQFSNWFSIIANQGGPNIALHCLHRISEL